MAKYERLQEAPYLHITFTASTLFKNLSLDGKDIVWRRFHQWVREARKKSNWHDMGNPDIEGLSEAEQEALSALTECARNGFCSLWDDTERKARNRNAGDGGATTVDGCRTDRRQKEGTEKKDTKGTTERTPRRVVNAANYVQRTYTEQELEDTLGVNEVFRLGGDS